MSRITRRIRRHFVTRGMRAHATLMLIWLTLGAYSAHADTTLFAGFATPSSPRPTFGISWGIARQMIGFEIEYASALKATDTIPSVGTIGANVLVQAPESPGGIRFYATGGFGIHAQSYGSGPEFGDAAGRGTYGTSKNIGVGAKLPLAGPVKLRIDYRYFVFSAEDHELVPLYFRSHRVCAGLTFPF